MGKKSKTYQLMNTDDTDGVGKTGKTKSHHGGAEKSGPDLLNAFCTGQPPAFPLAGRQCFVIGDFPDVAEEALRIT